MTKKTLLVVGAGIFQSYGIRVAKTMGLRVCVMDMNPKAPGVALADDFLPVSTRDIPGAILAAKQFDRRSKLNGVFTCGTDVSFTVASIAEALSLPGIPPAVAERASNKGLMREALKAKGVPVPEFRIVTSLEDARLAFRTLPRPLVIKPVDNMGARGVRQITTWAELEKAWPLTLQHSSGKRIILEEFMRGYELSIDTLVENGRVHLLTIADRIISGIPYFIERGHSIPSIRPKKDLDAAFEMAKRGIRALGITLGAAKFDMKVTPKGPRIGEMAARLSGGFHSQITDPLATGMNSIKAAIDLCLGNPLNRDDVTPRFHHAAVERSLYPKPGKVVSIRGVEAAGKMKNIEAVFLNVQEGDTLHSLTSNIGKAGHVVGFGKTRSEAVRSVRAAVRSIQINTKPVAKLPKEKP